MLSFSSYGVGDFLVFECEGVGFMSERTNQPTTYITKTFFHDLEVGMELGGEGLMSSGSSLSATGLAWRAGSLTGRVE